MGVPPLHSGKVVITLMVTSSKSLKSFEFSLSWDKRREWAVVGMWSLSELTGLLVCYGEMSEDSEFAWFSGDPWSRSTSKLSPKGFFSCKSGGKGRKSCDLWPFGGKFKNTRETSGCFWIFSAWNSGPGSPVFKLYLWIFFIYYMTLLKVYCI